MFASDVPHVPAYRLHNARQCAVVPLDGREIHPGAFGRRRVGPSTTG